MNHSRNRRQRGFSILELSIVLVIASLVISFGMNAGQNAMEGADRITTQERMSSIQKALENFVAQNGYLPCPAERDLTSTSASFGTESRSGAACATNGDITSVPTASPVIYIGGVPVRTLGLPDAYAADAWSNKYLYAVGMSHVGNTDSYMNTDGPITIKYGVRTGTNYAITTTRTGTAGAAATYVIVSHGPDGKGAYPLYGAAIGTACGAATATDVTNCDTTNATSATNSDTAYNAIFYDTAYNDSPAVVAKFFDDYVVWGSNALERTATSSSMGGTSGTALSSSSGASGTNICESVADSHGGAGSCDTLCSNAGYSSSGAVLTNCTSNNSCSSPALSCDYQCYCSGAASSGSSSGSSTGGCSSGACENWCAPCTNNAGSPGHQQLCNKWIVTTTPTCTAYCIWAGCSSGTCYTCP